MNGYIVVSHHDFVFLLSYEVTACFVRFARVNNQVFETIFSLLWCFNHNVATLEPFATLPT